MNKFIYILSLIFCYSVSIIAQTPDALYQAQLSMSWNDGIATVQGVFYNKSKKNEKLTYQLKLQRRSQNGNNLSNQQGGSFEIDAGKEQLIALTEFNVSELDLYRIYLRVYKNGKMITEDALVKWEKADLDIQKNNTIEKAAPNNRDLNDGKLDPKQPKIKLADAQNPPTPQGLSQESAQGLTLTKQRQMAVAATKTQKKALQKTNTNKSADLFKSTPSSPTPLPPSPSANSPRIPDLEIDGLIIDETRTKVGRDFYEVFYNKWTPPTQAKNYTITIKEIPGRSRQSQVAIYVNEERLIQRNVQPRAEMIEALAANSANAIASYLKKDAQRDKNISSEKSGGIGLY